jgi:tRNA (guanine37-N1)-methyltransferase
VRIDILTLFPQMFEGPFGSGIINRAVGQGLVEVRLHNIRGWAHDKHRTVDDYPYGGGAGMVLKPEPIFEAVDEIRGAEELPVVLLSPQGRLFSQSIARELANHSRIMFICGHYEGFDERIRQYLATDEISIGDYVLSGGELAAMVVIDAVIRLLPGALGSQDSAKEDSYSEGLLEYPQYTRPAVYHGWPVPEVLLSGNHARIATWRREQAIRRTLERRPELIAKASLSPRERRLANQPAPAQQEP